MDTVYQFIENNLIVATCASVSCHTNNSEAPMENTSILKHSNELLQFKTCCGTRGSSKPQARSKVFTEFSHPCAIASNSAITPSSVITPNSAITRKRTVLGQESRFEEWLKKLSIRASRCREVDPYGRHNKGGVWFWHGGTTLELPYAPRPGSVSFSLFI